MRRSPDVSPRRLSDISPQLRQLKYLVVDEAIKEDLKWSRSVEDLTSASVGLTSIEERILRITGYYGYQPWAASYKRESPARTGMGGCQDGGSGRRDVGSRRRSLYRWSKLRSVEGSALTLDEEFYAHVALVLWQWLVHESVVLRMMTDKFC